MPKEVHTENSLTGAQSSASQHASTITMKPKIMASQQVRRRLQANVTPAARDVAWAQIHDSSILEKYGIPRLNDQQLEVVEKVYEAQGGLQAATLDCCEHLYAARNDGTFFIINSMEQGGASVANKHNNTSLATGHAREEFTEPSSKKRRIERSPTAIPTMQRASESTSEAHDDRSPQTNKTTNGRNSVKIVFTPVQRLKRKYGSLRLGEDMDESRQETVDIGREQVPIGILRGDPTPTRIVTATIRPEDARLSYTVQPIDKNFVLVADHATRVLPAGMVWDSAEDMGKDSEFIAFTSALRTKLYDELLEYVFEELRVIPDHSHWNAWRSAADMRRYPELMVHVSNVRRFIQHKTGCEPVPPTSYTRSVGSLLAQLNDSAARLAETTKKVQDAYEWGRPLGERAPAAGQTMSNLWEQFGKVFEMILSVRRI